MPGISQGTWRALADLTRNVINILALAKGCPGAWVRGSVGLGDPRRPKRSSTAYLLLLETMRCRSRGPIPRGSPLVWPPFGAQAAASSHRVEGAAGASGAGHRACARTSGQRAAPQALSCGGGARLLKALTLQLPPLLPSVPARAGDARGH